MNFELLISQFLSKQNSKFQLNPKSKQILLGTLVCNLNVYFEGYIADLIIGAFIKNVEVKSDYVISIYMLDDFDFWHKELIKCVPNIHLEAPFTYHSTSSFKIFVCESQSQIYIFDKIRKHGIILIRDTRFLDTRSYVTPFRLMVSWIVNDINGEVIHASAISKNGSALVISGAKGSGKSTLALAWLISGGAIISDDALILSNNQAYAVYTRAKIDIKNFYTRDLVKNSFSLKNRQDAKNIFPLTGLGSKFILSASVKSIIIPKQSDGPKLTFHQKTMCRDFFIENSLQEIFGGEKENIIRLNQIVDLFDLAIFRTSNDMKLNMNIMHKELTNSRSHST